VIERRERRETEREREKERGVAARLRFWFLLTKGSGEERK
jgi:hypothetical protein